jgi:hypothetical protein
MQEISDVPSATLVNVNSGFEDDDEAMLSGLEASGT